MFTYNHENVLYIEAIPNEHAVGRPNQLIVHADVGQRVYAVESEHHKLVAQIVRRHVELQRVCPVLLRDPSQLDVVVGK